MWSFLAASLFCGILYAGALMLLLMIFLAINAVLRSQEWWDRCSDAVFIAFVLIYVALVVVPVIYFGNYALLVGGVIGYIVILLIRSI